MKVKIFVTGGTFDKEYNELNGELSFKETHLPEMLSLGRSRLAIATEVLMMIDSLDIGKYPESKTACLNQLIVA